MTSADFMAKKIAEESNGTYRLIRENPDGSGLFLCKGEQVILKRCKRGYWKHPETGECVPKEQLRNTDQPSKPKEENRMRWNPETRSLEREGASKPQSAKEPPKEKKPKKDKPKEEKPDKFKDEGEPSSKKYYEYREKINDFCYDVLNSKYDGSEVGELLSKFNNARRAGSLKRAGEYLQEAHDKFWENPYDYPENWEDELEELVDNYSKLVYHSQVMSERDLRR